MRGWNVSSFATSSRAPAANSAGAEFVRARGRPFDHVGEADAVIRQHDVVHRFQPIHAERRRAGSLSTERDNAGQNRFVLRAK